MDTHGIRTSKMGIHFGVLGHSPNLHFFSCLNFGYKPKGHDKRDDAHLMIFIFFGAFQHWLKI